MLIIAIQIVRWPAATSRAPSPSASPSWRRRSGGYGAASSSPRGRTGKSCEPGFGYLSAQLLARLRRVCKYLQYYLVICMGTYQSPQKSPQQLRRQNLRKHFASKYLGCTPGSRPRRGWSEMSGMIRFSPFYEAFRDLLNICSS